MASILIVEDEVALSDVLRADLEAEGHIVCQAFDGPSALSLVESQRPQLVVLDWSFSTGCCPASMASRSAVVSASGISCLS